MVRSRISLLLVSAAFASAAIVSCTGSEDVNPGTGAAGTSGQAGQGPAGQGPAGQGPAGQGPAGQGPAGQGPAGQGPAGQGPAGQGPAGNGPAGNGGGGAGTNGQAGNGAAGTTGKAGTGGGNAGTGGGAAGTGGGALSYKTDIEPILVAKCTPCHITGSDGQLSLKMNSGYANLVTNGAAKTDLTCTMLSTAKKRVVAGDPDHSYLWIKLNHTDAELSTAKCGPSMPELKNGATPLSADQKTKIHDWIMGGANP